MKKLYSAGSEGSPGFESLVDGYIDYSQEVITNRSLPDLRDGLKPVQRRALYALWTNKIARDGGEVSSQGLSGAALTYHPHADTSVYEAFVRMTDINGTFNVPLLKGEGNLSKVYSGGNPAAARYTKVSISPSMLDYFGDEMDAIDWKPNELATGPDEPSALPVNYPSILVNGSSGLAVSVSTTIPSFNFWDVLDLLEKRVKNGRLTPQDIIYPDFSTGGHYIKNDLEMTKSMMAGTGRIKVRADVEVEGSVISVYEMPYTKTVASAVSAIQDLVVDKKVYGLTDVVEVTNGSDKRLIMIKCRNSKVVDDVLKELYRRNILQSQVKSSILAVNNKRPVLGGAHRMLEEWLTWRLGIIKKHCEVQIESIKLDLRDIKVLIDLVDNPELRDEYVHRATHGGDADGLLRENFEGIVEDTIDWISKRTISTFNRGGRYRERYDLLQVQLEQMKVDLANPEDVVLRDIEGLRKSHKGMHKRKTSITTQDYKFTKAVSSTPAAYVEVDTSPAVFTIYKDGFIKKTSMAIAEVGDPGVLNVVSAQANSTLIGFDNIGRIIRVFGEDVPFTREGAPGEFVFSYLKDEPTDYDKYKHLLYMGLLDGSKRALLFRDGMVSMLDTSKWVDAKAKYKVINTGVSREVFDQLFDVIEEADFPEAIMVVDDARGTGHFRFSVMKWEDIRFPKSSSGQARCFKGENLHFRYWGGIPEDMVTGWLARGNTDKFIGRTNELPGHPKNPMQGMSDDFDFLGLMNEPRYTSVPVDVDPSNIDL